MSAKYKRAPLPAVSTASPSELHLASSYFSKEGHMQKCDSNCTDNSKLFLKKKKKEADLVQIQTPKIKHCQVMSS